MLASYAGLDIAEAQLDIAVRPSGEQRTSPHDEGGITAVVDRLRGLSPALIVFEAIGG